MATWKKLTAIAVLEVFIGGLAAPPFFVLAEPAAPLPLSVEATANEPAAGGQPAVLARKLIGPDGGILEAEGVRLEVPAGAVDQATVFVIQALGQAAGLNEGLANATPGRGAYRFEPDGARFHQPLTVSLAFEPALAGSQTALSNLFTYFHNEQTGHWERLPRLEVDPEACRVISTTTHFTDLVNATLQLPEGPEPLQFDVNAIKSLEAANPASGVPVPEGLEGGPFGSASFRINLKLPPGRGAAVPELALRYDSGGGGGLLGRGFDLGIPAITTDTRFGLPSYDGADTYMLEGEELVAQAADPALATVFRPLKEGAFARILRVRSGGREYWEVTDKRGSTRTFGTGEAWIGPDRADPTKVYTWYLSQVRDANGNTVDYSYEYDAEANYAYLAEIRYSGRAGGELGPYWVILSYEDREDRRSDGRGKFLSKLSRRVSGVEVRYLDTLVRGYQFNYRYDEFGQSQLLSYGEHDNLGQAVYTYQFEYYQPEPLEDGFQAFGTAEEQWGAPTDTYLHQGRSVSIGASLYLGLALYIPWFYFWGFELKPVLSVGVKGGLGVSSSATRNSLLDLNGDGLPDLVYKSGGNLLAYFNQDNGFAPGPAWSGLSGLLDQEVQDSFFLGASASLGFASGEVTFQNSWSKAKSSFADVNGDGFVDYVQQGAAGFAMNTGSLFDFQPFGFLPDETTPSGIDPTEEEDYRRTYYQQEPLRRWTAYRSGAVEVEQDAKLDEAASADGVVLRTYQGDFTRQQFPLQAGQVLNGEESRQVYNVERGKALYFHEDTLADEQGDNVRWNVKVSYTAVRLFEDLGDWTVTWKPPDSWASTLPWNDERLAPLYQPSTSGGETSYLRRSDWQYRATEDAYLALLEHGAFVPNRIPEALFQKMYDRGASETLVVVRPGTTEEKAMAKSFFLSAGYCYQPEWKQFLLMPEDELSLRVESGLVGLVLQQRKAVAQELLQALDPAERVTLGTYRWLDDRRIFSRAAGDGAYEVPVNAPVLNPPPVLSEPPELGMEMGARGLLVDRYTDPVSGGLAQIWLRSGSLVRELDGVQTAIPNAELSASGTDPLSVRYRQDGVRRELALEGRNTLLVSLPAAIYEGPLSDAVLAGESFSADGYATLPAGSWTAIRDAIPGETERALFTAAYEPVGPDYRLKSDVSLEVLQAVLRLLDERTAQAGSLFALLPGMAGHQNRLVRLSAEEHGRFTAAVGAGELFASYADASGTWFYPLASLSSEQQGSLLAAMASFRRDGELFPYYERSTDGTRWLLKEGLTETQQNAVRSRLGSLGLAVWGTVRRSLLYRSTDAFPVVESSPPGDGSEISLAPTGGTPRTADTSGRILLPSFDSGGQTVYAPMYLHVFDSAVDYSPVDLTLIPEQAMYDDARPARPNPFRGGVYGWYYGTWSGYYDWAEARLQENAAEGHNDKGTRPAPPPYHAAAEQNTDKEGKIQILFTGREARQRTVVPEAWVSKVSRYSDAELDESGQFATVEHTFACVIQGDQLLPNRNGGDAYFKIPRGSAVGKQGKLEAIRTSKTKATDINGSITLGPFGASLSKNSSKSRQYQGLLDLNGDRYPDLVQSPEGGGQNLTLLPGTGSGFGPAEHLSGQNSYLSYYESESYGFGGSLGTSTGSQRTRITSYGQLREATTNGAQESGGIGGTVGINGTAASSVQQQGFVDVNGDGLPDQVNRADSGSYSVAFNLGDGFAPAEPWSGGLDMQVLKGLWALESAPKGISHSGTGSFGGSVGLSVDAGVVGVGISAGYTGTVNQGYSQLVDVNGDGLPDQVGKAAAESFFRVRFNRGDQFGPEVKLYRPDWGTATDLAGAIAGDLAAISGALGGFGSPMGMTPEQPGALPGASSNIFAAAIDPYRVDDLLEYSNGVCYNFGANLTFRINLTLLVLTIMPGVNGSVATTSATLKFTDLDGDGLPDHVLKMPGEPFLRVKRNGLGTAGLLKTVRLPQGGRYELAYQRAGNTVALPQSRWVLSSLTKDDGLTELAPDRGEHRITVNYEYSDGYYDREQREFWGFGQVKSVFADGSKRVVHYHNQDHYRRGLAYLTEISDPAGGSASALLRETHSRIDNLSTLVVPVPPNAKPVNFPALMWERSRTYEEGRTDRYLQTEREYVYDDYGNVTLLQDRGDTATSEDDLTASISYASLAGYFKQHPSRITVEDGSGRLLRQREGDYDVRGNLSELRQWEETGVSRSHAIRWDAEGNLRSISDPRGATVEWTYDPVVRQYVTQIRQYNTQLGGVSYASSQSWDYALGVVVRKTDQAGESLEYSYDPAGRLTEVWSPYDTGIMPAVSYAYYTSSFPWVAVSENKLTYDPEDLGTIVTAISIDGLGRVAQTAKTGEVREADTHRVGWNLSGAVAYDAKGRTVAQGQPVFAEGGGLPELAGMVKPTLTGYDALDRVLTVTLPDGALTSTRYALRGGQALEAVSDPLGRTTERLLDARGNVAGVRKLDRQGNLLTSAAYQYNPLGEILEVLDHQGNAVRSAYDLLGRRTRLESPDAGVLSYGYDEAGNLAWKQSAVLQERGQTIRYEYDELNRLVRTDYPDTTDVVNVYGEPGAADGGAGRLVSRSDASGTVSYLYGKLGETVGVSRTIYRWSGSPVASTMRTEWDYLGRLQEVRYPDGEVLLYGYDGGGQIASATGFHDGYTEVGGLDHWSLEHWWWSQDRGQHWNRGRGWGWYSSLRSRDWNSWWEGHGSHTASSPHHHRKHPAIFTLTEYVKDIGYDAFGQRVALDLGNGVATSYSYDADRRWLQAISTRTAEASALQGISYSFDLVGNILGVSNSATAFGKGYTSSASYGYDELDQLVQASATLSKAVEGNERWRGEGWHANNSSTYTQSFAFDALGNLTRKTSAESGTSPSPPRASLNYDLTYQYLEGRVHQAERIGNFWYRYDGNGNLVEERRWGQEPLATQRQASFTGAPGYGEAGIGYLERTYSWDEENRLVRSSEQGGLTVSYRYGADGQRALKASQSGETLYFDSMWTGTADYPNGWRWSKHIYVGSTRMATRLGYDGREMDLDYHRVNTYYYHSDHLGSVQLVTDYQGKVYEHMEYTPYGELWVEHGPQGLEAVPYRFTGKELDSETGLYYYGARYLNPRTSRWISADPAMESYLPVAPKDEKARKYNQNLPGDGGMFMPVNMSTYQYALNNPIAFRDPTGLAGQKEDWKPDSATKMAVKNVLSNIPPILVDTVGSTGIGGLLMSLAMDPKAIVAGKLLVESQQMTQEAGARLWDATITAPASPEARWNEAVAEYKLQVAQFTADVAGAVMGVYPPENLEGSKAGLEYSTQQIKEFLYDPRRNPFFEKGKTYTFADLQYKELPNE